jgi:hypothetical protein
MRGFIAPPEEFQAKTDLYPGATFQIEVAPEGAGLLLSPLETRLPSEPKPGIQCG